MGLVLKVAQKSLQFSAIGSVVSGFYQCCSCVLVPKPDLYEVFNSYLLNGCVRGMGSAQKLVESEGTQASWKDLRSP